MATRKAIQNPDKAIFTLSEAVEWREQMEKEHKNVVFTNGCFDLMHRGHAEYLYRARCFGDALVIGLNSDKSIKSLKGDNRPFVDEYNRAYMLASLQVVDVVVIFNTSRCTKLIKQIKPDIYVKGGDYSIDNIDTVEKNTLFDVGSVIKFVPFVEWFSASKLLAEIAKKTSE